MEVSQNQWRAVYFIFVSTALLNSQGKKRQNLRRFGEFKSLSRKAQMKCMKVRVRVGDALVC